MKKGIFTMLIAIMVASCVTDPQSKQDESNMEHQRDINAIEFQDSPITIGNRGATESFDTTRMRDTSNRDTTTMQK